MKATQSKPYFLKQISVSLEKQLIWAGGWFLPAYLRQVYDLAPTSPESAPPEAPRVQRQEGNEAQKRTPSGFLFYVH